MTTQYRYGGRSRGAGSLLGVLFALALGAAALAMFLRNAQQGLAGRLAAAILGRQQSFVSAPDVVERIQKLNRLETVVYSLDTVVEGRESNAVLPDALAGDRLLMIVHGQSVAGIDLGRLKASDVQLTESHGERSIRLKLPPSELFLTTIDNAKSRVYARETGLFVGADPNLESATRLKAQQQLQAAALADGILPAATRNGQETVRAALSGLGFSRVELE